jgi:ubiquitin fusion degradation protein 1
METDLKVDFEAPVGYVEPERKSGTSTPMSGIGRPKGGQIHFQGTMAQSINYASIAPSATTAAKGEKALSSNFLVAGHTLKKGGRVPTPKASTPVAGASTNSAPLPPTKKTTGPQPLRLPPGKLFFGYEVKPFKKSAENGEQVGKDEVKPQFQGQGQTLRKKKGGGLDTGSGVNSDAEKGSGKSTGKRGG